MPVKVTDKGSNGQARIHLRDKFTLSQRTINDQGFLVAPARLARTGIQTYTARELGLDKAKGMASDALVNLYRPHEEVFAKGALDSFEGVTLTDDHPDEDVTPDTWGDVAVGDIHDIAASDPYMTGKVIVRDPDAIKAVQDGKSELSMGYSFELDLTPGQTATGEAYDGVMRNVRANHASIVQFGRAGHGVRIADTATKNKGNAMSRKVIVDGIGIDLEETHAAIVEKTLSAKEAQLKSATDASAASEERAKKAEDALKLANDASAKLVADHVAEVAKLKAQILSPEQVEALATERSKVVADAASIAPEVKAEGKAIAALRLEAVQALIANDEVSKVIAVAIVGDSIEKADEKDVRKAFDALVASNKTGDAAAARGAANDKSNGAALALSAKAVNGDGELTGRDAMIYRLTHGGLLPGEKRA